MLQKIFVWGKNCIIFSHDFHFDVFTIPLCLSLIITYVYFQAAEQAASRPGELGYTIALAARYLDFHIQYSINAIRNDLKIYVELFM